MTKPSRKAVRKVKRKKLSSPAVAAPLTPAQPSTAALTNDVAREAMRNICNLIDRQDKRRQAALKGWETRRRLDAIGDALLTPPEKRDRYQIGLLRSVNMDWEPEVSPTPEMGAKPSEAEPHNTSLTARIRSWWRKVAG